MDFEGIIVSQDLRYSRDVKIRIYSFIKLEAEKTAKKFRKGKDKN